MSIENLAPSYLETIKSVEKKIDLLKESLNTTYGLEARRKIRQKIFNLETVLRQNTMIYQHLKNYYNKDINIRGFM